jgi:multidrug efflux system membrane fusion protein
MARDQALLANARIDLERYSTLLAQDSIAKQLVDTQEALVRQYEGTVKLDQGQIDNARLQLTYSRVTAPIPGRVGLRQVDEGNVVHASDQNGIARAITQLQPITVVYDPAGQSAGRARVVESWSRVPVTAGDRGGTVRLPRHCHSRQSNRPDDWDVRVKAQFPNDDDRLFANQFVNVRMLVDTRRDATTVPSAASSVARGTLFIYVVKDAITVTLREVKTGPTEGDRTVIESRRAGRAGGG